jgi:hypothetical protein
MSPQARRALIVASTTYLVFHGIAYYFAVISGYGEAESAHDPSSIWMYVRRASLIGMALVLPRLDGAGGPDYGYSVSPRSLAWACGLGLVIGFGNRGGYELTSLALVAGAAFHTFATELYFRGYWVSVLERAACSRKVTIATSGLLYGLSTLTWFAAYHRELPPWGFILLFTFLGAVFAWAKVLSGSVLIAAIMHFVGVLNLKSLFLN